jgi:hypothetical protein
MHKENTNIDLVFKACSQLTWGFEEVKNERSKSVRTMWPSSWSKIFSGFRSRYIIPAIETLYNH